MTPSYEGSIKLTLFRSIPVGSFHVSYLMLPFPTKFNHSSTLGPPMIYSTDLNGLAILLTNKQWLSLK